MKTNFKRGDKVRVISIVGQRGVILKRLEEFYDMYSIEVSPLKNNRIEGRDLGRDNLITSIRVFFKRAKWYLFQSF